MFHAKEVENRDYDPRMLTNDVVRVKYISKEDGQEHEDLLQLSMVKVFDKFYDEGHTVLSMDYAGGVLNPKNSTPSI